MLTIVLLIISNVFMTIAWYWHLKVTHLPIWQVILISWAIAGVEYCFAVPANHWGYGKFSGFQLKVMQEVITLSVFVIFAMVVLKEPPKWNYVVSFALIFAAVYFAFLPTGEKSPRNSASASTVETLK